MTGKGGTGKTAVTAALGRALARTGRRTLLLEADPRENLHEMFAVPPSGGEIVGVGPGLYLQNVQPARVIEKLVREHVKIEMITRRVVQSPVYQHFSMGAPGIKELALLGYVLRRFEQGGGPERIETVVIDAPATGHGLALLYAPRLVSGVVERGPFGDIAARLAAWIESPSLTAVTIVTRAEEMPVQEALESRAAFHRRCGREPDLCVINALWPACPASPPPCPAEWDLLLELWATRCAVNARERERLCAAWSGPVVDLPYLPLPRGPELVEALAERLGGTAEDAP